MLLPVGGVAPHSTTVTLPWFRVAPHAEAAITTPHTAATRTLSNRLTPRPPRLGPSTGDLIVRAAAPVDGKGRRRHRLTAGPRGGAHISRPSGGHPPRHP